MTKLSGLDLFWLLVEALQNLNKQEKEIWKKFERLAMTEGVIE